MRGGACAQGAFLLGGAPVPGGGGFGPLRPQSGADAEFVFSLEPPSVIGIVFSGPPTFDAISGAAGAMDITAGPNNTSDWFYMGAGRLQYVGTVAKIFLITGAISGTNPGSPDEFDGLFIGVGGTPIAASGSAATFFGTGFVPQGYVGSITARAVRTVQPNQIVELFVQGSLGGSTLDILTLQLTVSALGS